MKFNYEWKKYKNIKVTKGPSSFLLKTKVSFFNKGIILMIKFKSLKTLRTNIMIQKSFF